MTEIQKYYEQLDDEVKKIIEEILKLEQEPKRLLGTASADFKKDLLQIIKNYVR